jgi:hypothetical protein
MCVFDNDWYRSWNYEEGRASSERVRSEFDTSGGTDSLHNDGQERDEEPRVVDYFGYIFDVGRSYYFGCIGIFCISKTVGALGRF